jgi:hypothetical protein
MAPTTGTAATATPDAPVQSVEDIEYLPLDSYEVEDRIQRTQRITFISNEDHQETLDGMIQSVGTEQPKLPLEKRTREAMARVADLYKRTANSHAKDAQTMNRYLGQLELRALDVQDHASILQQTIDQLREEAKAHHQETNEWKAKWADLAVGATMPRRTSADLSYVNAGRQASQTPLLYPGSNHRGIRIKDPDAFTGAIDQHVDDWIYDMRNKLAEPSSQLGDERLRVAYTARLVTGDAREQIRDRLDANCAIPIETTEEIFEILQQVYGESKETQRHKAKKEYAHLYQGSQPFSAFWAKFTRLTTKLGKSPTDQYDDLKDRMNLDLLREVSDRQFDNALGLARWCMEAENRLNLIKTRQGQTSRFAGGTTRDRSDRRPRDPSPVARTRHERPIPPVRRESPYPGPPKQVAFQGASDLQCFGCKQFGHIRTDCPNTKTIGDIEAESDHDDDPYDIACSDQEDEMSGNASL